MKMSHVLGAACACLAFTSMQVLATLIDRGGGLLYDDVLDITWLQDANYIKTSNYDADGKVTITAAQEWAEQLVYYDSVRNVFYDDWRLASNVNDEYPFHYTWWFAEGDPTPTQGPHSELSYMYYVNLGLEGYHNNNGSCCDNFGIHGDGTFGGENDVGLVINLQGDEYWSDSIYELPTGYTWTMSMNTGNHYLRGDVFYAWAVREGDIVTTPIPPSVWLFGTGAIALVLIARKRKAD